MVVIRPISDLRNRFNEISELCHKEGGPVYITKNGKGDLVVMSIARYEEQQALLELYQSLAVAEQQSSSKGGRRTHGEMMALLRKRLHG